MFFISSGGGRLGQAAVKPLYARQHARSRNTQLTPALTASLLTLHHLAHVALPRSIPLTSHPTNVPLVYADAFFAAGDRQYEVSDVVENKVAFTSAGITKLVNGFGVFMIFVMSSHYSTGWCQQRSWQSLRRVGRSFFSWKRWHKSWFYWCSAKNYEAFCQRSLTTLQPSML